jgi:hypothetical protein
LDIFVERLLGVAAKNDIDSIIFLLAQLVSGYKPKVSENNLQLEGAKYASHTSNMQINVLANIEPKSA